MVLALPIHPQLHNSGVTRITPIIPLKQSPKLVPLLIQPLPSLKQLVFIQLIVFRYPEVSINATWSSARTLSFWGGCHLTLSQKKELWGGGRWLMPHQCLYYCQKMSQSNHHIILRYSPPSICHPCVPTNLQSVSQFTLIPISTCQLCLPIHLQPVSWFNLVSFSILTMRLHNNQPRTNHPVILTTTMPAPVGTLPQLLALS